MVKYEQISKFSKKDKIDIIDEILAAIEKEIEANFSFFENRNDNFCIAIRQILINEKAYRNPALTRGDIMKRMDVGKNIFIKRFRYCFGVSFKECINSLRLMEAVILLKHSDLSIKEIAEKVGFGTIRTFQRQFIQKYGKSPNNYRKRF